jgi:CBS domain-containing protein
MGTKVSSVLKDKGHDVVTVAPQQTVASVIKVLAQNRIGAVPVINEEGQLIGIISERDIIRGMSEHADAVLTLPAEQLMTRDVKTCSSEDQLVDLMHIRTHLSLDKDAPDFRRTQKIGRIAAIPILGGLHHQYVRL